MTLWLWVGFIAFVLIALALDLGVLNRKAHVIGTIEALAWTCMWVTLALVFANVVYFIYEHDFLGIASGLGGRVSGRRAALEFLTGYIVEESLSLDNMVVIALILSYFSVPAMYQHRVLFWGIIGALAMRGVMIAAGTALLARFEWILYVFGAILLLTALKLLLTGEEQIDPERNLLVRLMRRVYPVSGEFHGTRFFVRVNGRRAMTLVFVALLVVQTSDVMFSVDSIPAVIAIVRDPFLVFTSNVFAVLGLRSLYFAVAGIVSRFRYLKSSLVVLLAFIGVKMLVEHWYKLSTGASLCVIVSILSVGIIASLIHAKRNPVAEGSAQPSADAAAAAMDPVALALFAWRQARRIAVLLIGSSVLLVGVVMLVTPGPGMVVIPLGLAILGTEFVWARRIIKRLKKQALSVVNTLSGHKTDRKD
jgi:tellurite resistance protein TerC